MAILNQILGNGSVGGRPGEGFGFQPLSVHPNFVLPPGVHPIPVMDPRGPQAGGQQPAPGGGGGGVFGNFDHLIRPRDSGVPPVGPNTAGGGLNPAAAPAAAGADGFGGGITGAIMRAFSGGGSGGLDPAKLMAMAGMI